jgi:hypothetical protein
MNAAGVCLVLVAVAWTGHLSSSTSDATCARESSAPSSIGTLQVPARRQPLTTDRGSPVAHDNEVMALAAHSGRLFAATDQWEYPGPSAYGEVLVEDSSSGPWKVFEQTQSLRVQAIESFPIPADQGLGSGHSLLIAQAVVNGRSVIQWLLDGAESFAPGDSYVLPSTSVDVRSFGAHESGGAWSVYAGAEPTGVLRGTWSPSRHTLLFDPSPELTGVRAGSPGVKTQKVTGFADCGGALYASINTRLYRRNDGDLPSGVPRWLVVYQAPPVGAFNSGLRGLTCVTHDHAPSLLVSTEGNGDVFRLDDLPRGQLTDGTRPLVPNLEFSPVPAIRRVLSAQGTNVPGAGVGSIDYVIAAYNDFETVSIDRVDRQVFGFEWAYAGGCPGSRRCGPTAFGAATYDAAACFAFRTDRETSPTYTVRCLSGPDFTPATRATTPIRSGQAFVSIRTIQRSPFGDGLLYYGGYDCNFFPADGTAWIASSTLRALRLDDRPKEGSS